MTCVGVSHVKQETLALSEQLVSPLVVEVFMEFSFCFSMSPCLLDNKDVCVAFKFVCMLIICIYYFPFDVHGEMLFVCLFDWVKRLRHRKISSCEESNHVHIFAVNCHL